MSKILLAIDPQNSFCNKVPQMNEHITPQIAHSGELFVPGADKDMERLGEVAGTVDFDDMFITLDSHNLLHISHPIWFRFVDEEEIRHPEPFTRMCLEDGEIVGYMQDKCVGKFKTTIEAVQEWTVEYIQKLTDKGLMHIIWPPHCIMATPGHNIAPAFMEGVLAWERKKAHAGQAITATKIMKGRCIYTEHFSAIRPEVKYPYDAEKTAVNWELLKKLRIAKEIVVGGEALNFCVRCSITDIVSERLGYPSLAKKIILLTDAMSEVPNCGDLGQQFLDDMKKLGVRTMTCAEYIASCK